MKTLAARLAYAMKETGYHKQIDLSERSGVQQSLISKILRGEALTSSHAHKLASAMEISANWLINGEGAMRVNKIGSIKLFDEKGDTGETLTWPVNVPKRYRAYTIKRKTGIAEVPAGTFVVVDPDMVPSTSDLIVINISNVISVYRYNLSSDRGLLSVDDARVPMFPVPSDAEIIGTVVQAFIPDLST